MLAMGCFLTFTSCHHITQAYRETFDLEDSESGDLTTDYSEFQEPGFSEADDQELAEQSKDEENKFNLLSDPEHLVLIRKRLQDLFPEKILQVQAPHVYFEEDRIRLELVDPNIPENIDWYIYTESEGRWHKGQPIKTSKRFKFNTI